MPSETLFLAAILTLNEHLLKDPRFEVHIHLEVKTFLYLESKFVADIAPINMSTSMFGFI